MWPTGDAHSNSSNLRWLGEVPPTPTPAALARRAAAKTPREVAAAGGFGWDRVGKKNPKLAQPPTGLSQNGDRTHAPVYSVAAVPRYGCINRT